MCYTVIPTSNFKKDLKYYIKKKNYYKLKDDIENLTKKLEKGDFVGDVVTNIKLPEGEDTYKVRMANTTANISARDGFRVIYYVIKNDKEVYYLTIYSKKDIANLTDAEIRQLIKAYVANEK
jgi:mRNA-degrading endonuclease RelE of RelBE toxin-antitoxin system